MRTFVKAGSQTITGRETGRRIILLLMVHVFSVDSTVCCMHGLGFKGGVLVGDYGLSLLVHTVPVKLSLSSHLPCGNS